MLHDVTSIVNNDVRSSGSIDNFLEEIAIGLIPNGYGNLIFLKGSTGGIDVDTQYARVWSKKTFPQLKRTTPPPQPISNKTTS